VILNDNLIQDSTYSGVLINLASSTKTITNLSLNGDTITTAGQYASRSSRAGRARSATWS